MHLRAAQPERHASDEILVTPMGLAVGRGRVARTGMSACRIGGPIDDMTLIEMDVHVDQGRPEMPAVERDVGWRPGVRCRGDRRDAPVGNSDVDQNGAVTIGVTDGFGQEGCRHTRGAEGDRRGRGEGVIRQEGHGHTCDRRRFSCCCPGRRHDRHAARVILYISAR